MEPRDAEAVAVIYNEGIAERATFRPYPIGAAEVARWLDRVDRFPILVADIEGAVAGWARVTPYSDFEPYSGVGELGVYVLRSARRGGVARVLVPALCDAARGIGYWKLIAKVFPDNEGSIRLLTGLGFRQVGLHLRHGSYPDGEWRDVVLLERSL